MARAKRTGGVLPGSRADNLARMRWRGAERARVRSALALACSLHVAALVTLGLGVTGRERAQASAMPAAVTQSEFELEVVPEATPELAVDGAALAAATPAVAGPKRRAQASAKREPVIETDVVNEPGTSDDAAADPEQPPAAPQLDQPIDLGLGPDAWRGWASVVKPDAATGARKDRRNKPRFRAPPASTTGGLQEGLEAHDRALGLGPSGPVLGALYRAAHGDVAPQTGVALFHVTVLSSGTVEVSLTGASDQTAAWTQVATRAAEALRKTPPHIPSSRAGVSMVVEITAEEVFPNGLKRKQLHGPRVEAQAPRLQSGEKSQAELKKLNPVVGDTGAPVTGTPAIVDLPGVYVAQTGKVCSYRLGLSVLGPSLSGGCELSNVGAKAERMVHTQVREETFF
jgi:hypothetical protein